MTAQTRHVPTETEPAAAAHPAPAATREPTGWWRSAARARPAFVYVLLAIGLSWLVWLPALWARPEAEGFLYLGAFGPAVAGAVMVRAHGGRIRDWLRGMAIFRVRLRWYALALALPLIDPAIQAVMAARAGVSIDVGVLPGRLPTIAVMLVMTLLLGGGQEEPGWRGWLLPRLQSGGTNPLAASLFIGAVWAVWHLPLYLIGPYEDLSFALYAPAVVAMAVVFTWLYNSTGGSVVLAMILHGQVNTAQAWVPVADGAASGAAYADAVFVTVFQIGILVAYVVAALAVVAASGTRLNADRSGAGDERGR